MHRACSSSWIISKTSEVARSARATPDWPPFAPLCTVEIHGPRTETVLGQRIGWTRRVYLHQSLWPTLEPIRSGKAIAPGGQTSRLRLSLSARSAYFPPHLSSHHRHAPAASQGGYYRDRPLAGPRNILDHSPVRRVGSKNERSVLEEITGATFCAGSIQALRQPVSLLGRTLSAQYYADMARSKTQQNQPFSVPCPHNPHVRISCLLFTPSFASRASVEFGNISAPFPHRFLHLSGKSPLTIKHLRKKLHHRLLASTHFSAKHLSAINKFVLR